MTTRRLQARQIQIWLAAAGALLALVLLPAVASAVPYDILIAKADGGNYPAKLESALQAQPEVSNVSVFDAGVVTPSPNLIDDYDVVIPYSNTNYESATDLGNRLANFVDAGGVVIPLTFDGTTNVNRSLGGRWIVDEYRPWVPGATVNSTPQTLGSYDATHPLFQGVAALGAMYRFTDVAPAPGATQLASWSGGSPLVAVKGRVVGINAMLGNDAEWSGDFARLIVNAANWLYPQPAPPPPPPPVEPPVVSDTTKPAIGGLVFKPKAFRAAAPGAKSGGTKISFSLSEAATIRFTVERRARGRKAGGSCVAPRPRNRGARGCVRWLKVRGQIELAGVAGANGFRFAGRLAGRKLAPGSYRLVSVATDTAGNRSAVVRRAFSLLAPKPRR